jgi:MFS family permease
MQQTEILIMNQTKPDSKLMPWFVCFSAALFFFYEFIQQNMFNAINTWLMQDFSLSAAQLGFLSANYFYANLIFLLPAGLILDRLSTRKVILISLFICIFGTFSFALSTNFYWASLFRFMTGIGSAFCFLGCIRLATRWFPSNKMALVSGLIVTMAMTGGMVAQTPLTALVNALGWRHALFVDGAIGMVIFTIIFAVVKDYPKNYLTVAREFSINSMGFWQGMRKSYLRLQNWLGGIYTCMMNLPLALFGALWGILYLQQVHHLHSNEASFITSMLFVGTIIGSPLAGFLSDKIGKRKIPMLIGPIISMPIIFLILEVPFHSVTSLMILFFALGLITATQVISYPTVAESNSHTLTATSVSVVSFTTISGYAWAQPLFGSLMDRHWNGLMHGKQAIYSVTDFNSALIILPIAFVIAIAAALLIKETNCKNQCPSQEHRSR